MAGGDYWRAGNEALMTYTCFKLDALTPSLWRTTFNNPSINLIDVRMIAELPNSSA